MRGFGVPGDDPDGPISTSFGPAIPGVQMAHFKIVDFSTPVWHVDPMDFNRWNPKQVGSRARAKVYIGVAGWPHPDP